MAFQASLLFRSRQEDLECSYGRANGMKKYLLSLFAIDASGFNSRHLLSLN